MLPYPSGKPAANASSAGYIASTCISLQTLQGFNVLNPMGYDVTDSCRTIMPSQNRDSILITTVNNINTATANNWDKRFLF